MGFVVVVGGGGVVVGGVVGGGGVDAVVVVVLSCKVLYQVLHWFSSLCWLFVRRCVECV